MAWPVDALYEAIVAGATTAKKSLADALQNAIIGVVGGGKSIKKLWVDGVGDVANGDPAGVARVSDLLYVDTGGNTIGIAGFQSTVGGVQVFGDVKSTNGYCIGNRLQADNTRSSATVGAGQSLTIGQAWKDTLPIAWARCYYNGAKYDIRRGVNISSIDGGTTTGYGTGVCHIVLTNGAANYLCPIPSPTDIGADNTAYVDSATLTTTVIEVHNKVAGVLTDNEFSIVVFGG